MTIARLAVFTAVGLSWAVPAAAFDYVGGDWAGADLDLLDGDTLEGSFTNVGAFTIPQGVLMTVVPEVALGVFADTIVIGGDLDATGAGSRGAPVGEPVGSGPGGGQSGLPMLDDGGAGGSFAGRGGDGASSASGPGARYPTALDVLGSGGGAGGSATADPGHGGGHGGGSISLVAPVLVITGTVSAAGTSGDCSVPSHGGAGSGLKMKLIDIDDDGDLDVVGTQLQYRVVWVENLGGGAYGETRRVAGRS